MRILKNLLELTKIILTVIRKAQIDNRGGYWVFSYKDIFAYIGKDIIRLYTSRDFVLDSRTIYLNSYKGQKWVNLHIEYTTSSTFIKDSLLKKLQVETNGQEI